MTILPSTHYNANGLESHIIEGMVGPQKNNPILQGNDMLITLVVVLPPLAYAHSLCRWGTS